MGVSVTVFVGACMCIVLAVNGEAVKGRNICNNCALNRF